MHHPTAKIIGSAMCGNSRTFAAAMKELKIATQRGIVLDATLFGGHPPAGSCGAGASRSVPPHPDTVMIAITGIHGNFYSNPFYYTVGDTLAAAGIDFIYAQTCDAFGTIHTLNAHTGAAATIGSWNERFADALDDVGAYVDHAQRQGYRHIVLAGHSLGANKVIHYLSAVHDPRVEHFFLLSPANLDYMTGGVSAAERDYVRRAYAAGRAQAMLPFPLMGWVECQVGTAYDWLFGGLLNNVHTSPQGDFGQVERITHTGALLIGTYDNFTDGDPAGFLRLINSHMPTTDHNTLLFIERTGHTYQQKHQELADKILTTLKHWNHENDI